MAENKNFEQALPKGYILTGGDHDYEIEKALGQGGFGITRLVAQQGTMNEGAMMSVITPVAEAQHGLTPQAANILANLYENDFAGLPKVDDVKAHVEKLRNTKESRTLLNMLNSTKF